MMYLNFERLEKIFKFEILKTLYIGNTKKICSKFLIKEIPYAYELSAQKNVTFRPKNMTFRSEKCDFSFRKI